jgi:hypothetical protein
MTDRRCSGEGRGNKMVARIDWLSNGIDRMLAGKSPLTPDEWEVHDGVLMKDVELLRVAAQLNSLRADASTPDMAFVSGLRASMIAAAEAASAGEGNAC